MRSGGWLIHLVGRQLEVRRGQLPLDVLGRLVGQRDGIGGQCRKPLQQRHLTKCELSVGVGRLDDQDRLIALGCQVEVAVLQSLLGCGKPFVLRLGKDLTGLAFAGLTGLGVRRGSSGARQARPAGQLAAVRR